MRRESRPSRMLQRFGRLLASASVALYGVMFLGSYFHEPAGAYLALLAVVAIAAAGAVAAWLNDSAGGVMLVGAGVAMAICAGVVAEKNRTAAILLTSGPFLVAGLALLSAAAFHAQWRYKHEGGG
jgi:hypothetical protein